MTEESRGKKKKQAHKTGRPEEREERRWEEKDLGKSGARSGIFMPGSTGRRGDERLRKEKQN